MKGYEFMAFQLFWAYSSCAQSHWRADGPSSQFTDFQDELRCCRTQLNKELESIWGQLSYFTSNQVFFLYLL